MGVMRQCAVYCPHRPDTADSPVGISWASSDEADDRWAYCGQLVVSVEAQLPILQIN
jgi:hypothetical protein